jgi:sulfur carrier protein ThiS
LIKVLAASSTAVSNDPHTTHLITVGKTICKHPNPMAVWLTYRDKIYEVPPGLTVHETLKRIGITPETVISTENGQLVDEDTILVEGQVIKLVPVISGG